MGWTPGVGAKTLSSRLGKTAALDALTRLLAGEVRDEDLVWDPYRSILLDIGDGHAESLMADETGGRLVYWPRAWAARALAYIGGERVGPALLAALADDHWRVRMNAAQAIGRLGIEGATSSLVRRLDDDHGRVRAAAVLALERVGTEDAVKPLLDRDDQNRGRIERAVANILDRSDPVD
jgi:hypothetical protein